MIVQKSPVGQPNTDFKGIDQGKDTSPEITYFDRIIDTKGKHITFLEFFKGVKSVDSIWKSKIERLRGEPDEKHQKRFKRDQLPYVTISGKFDPRNEEGLKKYSGLIAMDIDNLTGLKGDLDPDGGVRLIDEVDQAQQAIIKDSYTYAVFKSARGRGLCVVVKGGCEKNHLAHYRFAENHYKKAFGLVVDKACKDKARARFVSWDQGAYMDSKATPVGLLESYEAAPSVTTAQQNTQQNTQQTTQRPTHTPTPTPTQVGKGPDIERIVNELVTGGHNICHDYDTWVLLSFSLATLLEQGRVYFHSISQVDATKYDYKTADTQFDNALKTGNGTVTIGTFFDMAEKAGVELYTPKEKKTYAQEMSEKRAQDGGVKSSKDGGDADKSKSKALHPFAILNFILENFDYTFNPLIGDYEFEGQRVKDPVKMDLLTELRAALCPKITHRQLEESLFVSPGRTVINGEMIRKPIPIKDPVTEYIKTLQDTPRDPEIINRFVDSFPIKDPRAKPLLKKWILSFASTYIEGKSPGMVVLVGGDRGLRAHALNNLIPPGLRKYYQSDGLREINNAKRLLCRNVMVGAGEIQKWKPWRLNDIEEIILQEECTWRELYDRQVVTTPRRAMLAGTASDTSFLDPEGNEGFLCVELEKAGAEITKGFRESFDAIDKTTLFNEAWIQGQDFCACQLNEEDLGLLQEISDERPGDIDEEDLTLKHVKPNDGTVANTEGNKTFITATEIKMVLHEKYRAYNLSTKAISKVLRGDQLNYQSQRHHQKRGFWLELEGLSDIIEKQKERFDTSPAPIDTPEAGHTTDTADADQVERNAIEEDLDQDSWEYMEAMNERQKKEHDDLADQLKKEPGGGDDDDLDQDDQYGGDSNTPPPF